MLLPGDPAPWFIARCTSNERYHFDSVAGRYVVLCLFGSAGQPQAAAVLAAFLARRESFDDDHACFFGVSVDPEDERARRVSELLPGFRWIWDFNGAVSKAYGAARPAQSGAATEYVPHTLLLDERLRVAATVPFGDDAAAHVDTVLAALAAQPKLGVRPAPVLVIPRVFEPALCRRLIEHYETHGGQDSGVMRDRSGMTVGEYDHGFKRRRDQEIVDDALRQACVGRINRRVAPEIARAFAFQATRIERHIVSCYDSETGGFFRAHRDNLGKATRHRRFAVTLNLNTGEYAGGELRFPEFGKQTYGVEAGGAIVFSCSMLHEATPVTSGRRFAYLPFLYDEAAAKVREEGRQFLAGESK